MSRPSTTMPPSSRAPAIAARWRSSSRARTSGTALTALTAPVTSGVRIAAATSAPSTVMVGADGSVPQTITGSPQRAATAAGSSTGTSYRSIHQVIARYIAPVSRYLNPSRSATPREVLDLPEPEGPSIATTTPVRAGALTGPSLLVGGCRWMTGRGLGQALRLVAAAGRA